MPTSPLHHALLRPAVVQILRASGFHSATPTALDAMTDILARYLSLLATRAAARAAENHNGATPDVTDVRMAMVDCGLLTPTATATQEVWSEILRAPLDEIPARNGFRDVQADIRRREDTGEIEEFVAWVRGPENAELHRIAGLARDAAAAEAAERPPDYLTAIKTKHSKAGEETRFQGTVLGIAAEHGPVKIDGGPPSIKEWLSSQAARRHQAPLSPSLLADPHFQRPKDPIPQLQQQMQQNHEPPAKRARPG